MPEGILQDLHQDHEQVSEFIEKLLKTEASAERTPLFKDLMNMLLAHSHAEQNVLYKKMEKAGDEKARSFAFSGMNEHQIVEQQLQQELVVAGPDVTFCSRTGAHEHGQRGADQPARERAEHSDPHRPALAHLRQPRRFRAFAQHLERAAGVRQEALAERGQPQVAGADEQRAANRVLEGENARADRRLSKPERVSGATESTLASDAVEGDDLVELHRRFQYHECTGLR